MGMQLASPGMVAQGQGTPLTISQQYHEGETGASVAGVQFSNGPTNPGDPEDQWPWDTARPVGEGGPVNAPAVPFDERNSSWAYSGVVWNEMAFVRVGIWSDQGLTGSPLDASNAVRPVKLISQMG